MGEEGRGGVGGGLRTGMGILVAFKEAIEETIEEARLRGDFTPERARSLVQEATERVQHSVEDAREKLDFVPRKEFDALKSEIARLEGRLRRVEQARSAAPDDGASDPGFPVD